MTHRTSNAFGPLSGRLKEGGAGEHEKRPPKCRLNGGDPLRGGLPLSSGHAGRQALARHCMLAMACGVFLTLVQCFGGIAPTTRAYASQVLRFLNGGTAQQNDDGTITGRCSIRGIWHGLDTSYEFTMPDGQVLPAHCIDYGYVNPADDEYDFTAWPVGDGSYRVSAHTDRAQYYQHVDDPRIPADGALVQRTESDGTWTPQVVRTGIVRIQKNSALPSLTNGLATYTLKNATFGIYRDAACTQRVEGTILTTDEAGICKPANLDEGTYWAREDTPPSGFAPANAPQAFTVTAGETSTVTFVDDALYESVQLMIQKADADTGVAQGSASLEGAEFAVHYYDGTYTLQNLPDEPKRSWVLRSNAKGEVLLNASARVGSTPFYMDAHGTPVLPVGTIVVQETKAPTGYYLEGQTSSSPSNYRAPLHCMTSTGHQSYAAPRISETVRRAGISLQKQDSETGSAPQGDSTLSGVSFAIYNANATNVVVDGVVYAPGQPIGSPLVTNDQGRAQTSSSYLPLGVYEVREVSTNGSLRNTSKPQRVTLGTSQTNTLVSCAEAFADEVVRGGLSVAKHDADLHRGQAQGDATLAGAAFSIILDSEGAVRVGGKTYSKGQTVATIHTNAEGVAQTGERDLPYATYLVRESKGPEGYARNMGFEERVAIREDGKMVSLMDRACEEPVIRGGVRLGKMDRDLKAQQAQGDATLSGAVFSIYLKSSQPVVVGDATYSAGQVVTTIETDEHGMASTGNRDLPYATYVIRETTAPEGYLANETFEREFSIREDGTMQELGSDACEDAIIRGGIAVGKVSRETSQHVGQGEATLKGATFAVTLKSSQSVVVAGTSYEPDSIVCTLVTGENGYAATDAHLLPYGTYEVREVEAPDGFILNEDWQLVVEIREDGLIYDKSSEADSVDDQVMRGGFGFNKVDNDTMERMGVVPFRVTSITTGESHVVVTDENGLFHTESNAHDNKTNANDEAVDDHETLLTDKVALDAGVWFSGRTDMETQPRNDMGALPYDTYEVRELRAPANEGKELVAFTVKIHEHGYVADMGTVDNKTPSEEQPRIGTTLTYDDMMHVAPSTEHVSLVDAVRHEGLKPGQEYELRGELKDKESGEVVSSASTTFVPKTSAGKVDMPFEVDARTLCGKTVVAFEHLYAEGQEVASHEDMDDAGQTMRFPSIATTCGGADGDHEVSSAGDRVVLKDTVEYHNLEPGKRCELMGTLYDKTSGQKLTDDDGREISALVSFVPETADGTVEVTFSLSPQTVRGSSLVAFEELRRMGVIVATHEDPEDEGQSVTIPAIETQLADEQGNHTIGENENVTLVDTVSFASLVPGTTYGIVGRLMDKATGEPIQDAQGNAVEARATFVPSVATGTTRITFTVNRAFVVGRRVVAFESLMRDERELAIHANIEDEAQTVGVPSLGTRLANDSGSQDVEPNEQICLVDTVAYAGLMQGEEYTISGRLVDKTTGDPLRDSDGNEVTTTQKVGPGASSGTVQVSFSIDARALAGKDIVAFEQLLQGDGDKQRIIARHEDLSDEGQTIHVVTPKPKEDEAKEDKPKEDKSKEEKPKEDDSKKNDLTPTTQNESKTNGKDTQKSSAGTTGGTGASAKSASGGVATPKTGDASVPSFAFVSVGIAMLVASMSRRR